MTDDRCGCNQLASQHTRPDGGCAECWCPAFHYDHTIVEALVCGHWTLKLPDYRAYRRGRAWHEAARLHALFAAVHPGDVVYEVGAEEGDYAALFTTWGAKVVLVEPNPWCWPSIKASMDANGTRPWAWLQGFLADRAWKADTGERFVEPRFGRAPEWPPSADEPLIAEHGFQHIAEHGLVTGAWTLDQLAARAGQPQVVSIDVEGGELHVLKGARKTLTEQKPVVFVSIHPPFLRDLYDTDPAEVHDLMAAHGYEGIHLATDHEVHYMFIHPEGRRV